MSTQPKTFYQLRKKDITRASATLRDAFQNDPVWRKVFEGQSNIEKKQLAFYEIPIRYCMKYGEVYATSDKLEGIAAWVQGDLSYMTPWRVITSGVIRATSRLGLGVARKMRPAFSKLESNRRQNMAGRSFLYLNIIGVSPEHQGHHFGGVLLEALIERSNHDNVPIYLETETEQNIKLYEKYGFVVAKKIILPIIKLPMWEMIREPDE